MIRPSTTSITTFCAGFPSHAWSACHVPDPFNRSATHGDADAALQRHFQGTLVARVRVADHACSRVVGPHALQLAFRLLRAVGDHDHPGVHRATDPDTTAVMQADP